MKKIRIDENSLRGIVRNTLKEYIDDKEGFYVPDDDEYYDLSQEMALDNERYEDDLKAMHDEEDRFIGIEETAKPSLSINESELRELVDKTVKGIIKEAYGFVPSDGNSMVGGSYDSWTESGEACISDKFIDKILDISEYDEKGKRILTERVVDAIIDYISKHEDYFCIDGTFYVSYDESTNYGSANMPVYELKSLNKKKIEEIKEMLRKIVGSDEEISRILIKALDFTIENLEVDDFKMYDRD